MEKHQRSNDAGGRHFLPRLHDTYSLAIAFCLVLVGALQAHAELYRRGNPDSGCVALTFDDGPGPYTEAVLDILKAEGVPATFFLTGEHVLAYPATTLRIAAEGHEVGNHSWDHPRRFDFLSASEAASQIARTDAAIEAVLGFVPAIFRPPNGSYDAGVMAIADRPLILWDFATLDWLHDSEATAVRRVERLTHSGSIILMHDVQPVALRALPAIIEAIEGMGYGFVTVSGMLAGASCREHA